MAVKSSKTKTRGRGIIKGRRPDGLGGIDGRGVGNGRVIIKCRWHRRSGGIIT